MSSEPSVVIRFEGDQRIHRPGEPLAGEYWIEALAAEQTKAVEVSVLWHTEGKGDEDMVVHEFWRRDASDDQPIDPRRPERFSTTLPNSPLSYDGPIIKLRWCVRVRVFPLRGKEIVGEKRFQLGDVPAVGIRNVVAEPS
ncbi:MAG: hypothetical protein WCB27_10945 [Thermoguttaceae bacterium]|jgi:hypothetical protein